MISSESPRVGGTPVIITDVAGAADYYTVGKSLIAVGLPACKLVRGPVCRLVLSGAVVNKHAPSTLLQGIHRTTDSTAYSLDGIRRCACGIHQILLFIHVLHATSIEAANKDGFVGRPVLVFFVRVWDGGLFKRQIDFRIADSTHENARIWKFPSHETLARHVQWNRQEINYQHLIQKY